MRQFVFIIIVTISIANSTIDATGPLLALTDSTSVDRESRTFETTDEGGDEGGDEGDPVPTHGLWVAGFTIAVVFSILNAVGINLQKYSLHQESLANTGLSSCQQPIWLLGFFLLVFGSIMDFVAFGMAPQTLLAPLGALSLVWNLLIAPVVHNEIVTRQHLSATAVIFAGVTTTVLFAERTTPDYDLNDLLRLYRTPQMVTYLACVVLVLLLLFHSKRTIERTKIHENGMFHLVCYGGIAGVFGGQSVLLAKSTAELVKTAVWGVDALHDDVFTKKETYLIIVGMLACLLCQIVTLNGGLARFDALLVIPVYQSFWVLTSVLGGIVYFEEYHDMTWLRLGLFALGCGVTLAGIVYLLHVRRGETDIAHATDGIDESEHDLSEPLLGDIETSSRKNV